MVNSKSQLIELYYIIASKFNLLVNLHCVKVCEPEILHIVFIMYQIIINFIYLFFTNKYKISYKILTKLSKMLTLEKMNLQ
jgi:hypothetical protein